MAPSVGSPLFTRYYEDAKTSGCSSRRSSFFFEQRLPPCLHFLSLASGSWSCSRCAWALVYRFRLNRFFSWRKPVGSLKFPGYPFVLLPCSQTPVGSPRQAFCGASILPPRCRLRRLQHQVIISRLNHTALAPAPYASCRHRCRLRNVRFRLVASLCRVGFFTHWVPVLCFRVLFSIRLHALPHILGLLDATATPVLL